MWKRTICQEKTEELHCFVPSASPPALRRFRMEKAPSARFLKSIPHTEGALHGHFSFLSANSRSTANNTGYKTAAMTHTIHVLCQSLLGREITRYKAVTTLQ